MRKSKGLIMLVISAAIGLAATGAAAKYLNTASTDDAEPAKPTKKAVAVAAVKIAEGKEIVISDVKKEQKLIEELPGDVVEAPELLVGRVAQVVIEKGDVISETKLVLQEKPLDVDSMVKAGYRAMAIKVDKTAGKSDVLTPGLHVDVLAVFETSERGGGPISRTVLQDIEVLAVKEEDDKKGRTTRDGPTVVVAVLPEEAETLALAMTTGRIVLIARPAHDPSKRTTRGVTKVDLEPAKPAPPAPPPKPPAPAQLLAAAMNLIAAGQVQQGEARLREIALTYPDTDAGKTARAELDATAARRQHNRQAARFEQVFPKIEALVGTGDFAKARAKIEEAQVTFGGLETDAGAQADELLEEQLERVKKGEKHARHLYTMVKSFYMNNKADLAGKRLAQLEQLYPRSEDCGLAKARNW